MVVTKRGRHVFNKVAYKDDLRRKTYYLLFVNPMVPNLNKLESSLPKDALCQVWLKSAQWF